MPLSLSLTAAAMAAPLPTSFTRTHPTPHVRRLAHPTTPHARLTVAEEEGGRKMASAGLRRESLPRHVAVIMDGNRRWARMRGLPVDSGYEAGLRSLRAVAEACCELGIQVLTVFAFSIDNWLRPKVSIVFSLSLSLLLGLRLLLGI